jgi:periplasmic protein TonB
MQIKKYSHKNLNRNRMLYFQLGLSIVLTFSLISIEWKSYSKPHEPEEVVIETDFIDQAYVIELPKKELKPIEKRVEPKKDIDPVIDNEKPDVIFNDLDPEPNVDLGKILGDIEKPLPEDISDVPSVAVEYFPIFPGCEKYHDREERKNCMSSKLYKFVGKNFDTQLASDLNLSGTQKIYVLFKVSHTGKAIFVNSRASHPELEKEAERIIQKLPEFSPGKMGEKPVNVLFSLPINFKVND